MSKYIRKTVIILLYTLVITIALLMVYGPRFATPVLTAPQIFLEYWWTYALGIPLIGGLVVLAEKVRA